MKRIALLCVGVLCAVGCLVHSVQPFCTTKSKVTLTELNGEWDVLKAWGDDVAEKHFKPWVFSNDTVLVSDANGLAGKLDLTYFKLGSQFFCDSIADAPDEKSFNEYWFWHLWPMHTVSKVELTGAIAKFRPLDLEWLTNVTARAFFKFPPLDQEDTHWPIYTATPQQWERFLRRHAADAGAFPDAHAFVLKRRTGGKS